MVRRNVAASIQFHIPEVPMFESRPGDRLFWLMYCVVFLKPSFPSTTSKFITETSTHHSAILLCSLT
jgi:hypothetical protein